MKALKSTIAPQQTRSCNDEDDSGIEQGDRCRIQTKRFSHTNVSHIAIILISRFFCIFTHNSVDFLPIEMCAHFWRSSYSPWRTMSRRNG